MMDQLKPYPAYKDSGVPWLGDVPEHWNVERAKGLFNKMNRPVREVDEVVTCFRDGIVTLRKNRRVRGFTESLKEIGYQGIRRGDLVIHAMDAFAGAVGVADSDGKGSPVYSVCQPGSRANSTYYAYIIREMARSQWILALAKGIRERSTDFRFDTFASQYVPIPRLAEQEAITRYLTYIDRRIRKYIRAKQKLIKLLEEQKQAIIHTAVTRGLDPHVPLKPSGIDWLGDIPAHWKVIRIKYILREVDHRSITGEEILLSLRMNHGIVPHSEHFTRPGQASTLVGYKKVHPGQIVLNKMQANNGLVFASELFGLVSPDYAVFDSSKDVDIYYLTTLFRTPQMKHKFRVESKGLGTGTSGFLRLYSDRFGMVSVPLPPKNEQTEIVKNLDIKLLGLQNAIARVEREINLIREFRTRLIADVVTGKLDVRTVAAALPPESEENDIPEVDDDTVEDAELADAFDAPDNADD